MAKGQQMTNSTEAEQQKPEQETTDPPKPRDRRDRFTSYEGEMTITPPKPEKPAEEESIPYRG